MAYIGFDNEQIGSVGHLVGASFETAGHYLQSSILQTLDQGFASSFGLLLYLIAAVTAFFIVALGGKYQIWSWFLVGPPILFALTSYRVPSEGARWQFGSKLYPKANVHQAAAGTMTTSSGLGSSSNNVTPPAANSVKPAQVSWFFGKWNEVSSGIVQAFVSLIQAVGSSDDLTFISNAERYEMLFKMNVQDSLLKQLINIAAVNRCADYYILMKDLYSVGPNDIRRAALAEKLAARGRNTTISSVDEPRLEQWLTSLGLWSEVKAKYGAPSGTVLLNCDQLWQISIQALKRHFTVLMDLLTDMNRPYGLDREKVKAELEAKFSTVTKHADGYLDTMTNDQRLILMINEGASRMFLREISRIKPNLAASEFEAFHPDYPEVTDEARNTRNRSIRLQYQSEEYEGKADFLSTALALPYVQGMALYFLAWSFPIFAMAMIIPGRHMIILNWMALWFWVKLWDFGYAVVMLIDRILYALLPHGPLLDEATVSKPGAAIKAMLESDPSYSAHIYYNIIATCLAAVPVLTGIFVKRAGGELVNHIAGRLQTFSGKIGYALASYERSARAQSSIAQAQRNQMKALDRALWRSLEDPEVQVALGGAAAARALKGLSGQKLLGAIAAMPAEQQKNIALAKIEQNLAEAVYAESLTPANRLLSTEAIRQRYNSHDFSLNYPGEQHLSTLKMYHHRPFLTSASSGTRLFAAFGGLAMFRSLRIPAPGTTNTPEVPPPSATAMTPSAEPATPGPRSQEFMAPPTR